LKKGFVAAKNYISLFTVSCASKNKPGKFKQCKQVADYSIALKTLQEIVAK